MESGETERVEIVVAQGLLDRRMSGHAPETGRRTGGDRCIELRYATAGDTCLKPFPTKSIASDQDSSMPIEATWARSKLTRSLSSRRRRRIERGSQNSISSSSSSSG